MYVGVYEFTQLLQSQELRDILIGLLIAFEGRCRSPIVALSRYRVVNHIKRQIALLHTSFMYVCMYVCLCREALCLYVLKFLFSVLAHS